MKNEDANINTFYWEGRVYRYKLVKAILLDEISFQDGYKKLNSTTVDEYTEDHPVFKRCKDLIEKKQIYRKQKLTLDILAKKLKTNRTTLSAVINQVSQQRFTDFINTYRVKEAKTLLGNPDFDKYKISAIGYEVGFSHVSTFYNVFKKLTGVTPTAYRQSLR
ncbi:helix-turn-helix domain-containing protein [Aquimarina megaterium]|uniref:helix-turn-helix domain-containing protein n=1 Tax=Aquimarina megaterium TaxID=1443666 RepID=UPI0009429D27|nr:AraC family transcriptional regulator [Aquimarina megaterium]